jgi:hypothetical protein
MRAFVIGTGRCGTQTFSMACKHITNYTSGHETHTGQIGDLDYPDGHIEVDHHLGWATPLLVEKYPPGPDTLYVHLLRDREACVASWSRRQSMDHFSRLCCFAKSAASMPEKRRLAAEYYVSMMTSIIESSLHTPRQHSGFAVCGSVMTGYIENLADWFPEFWRLLCAEGDRVAALAECGKRYNRGLESKGQDVRDEH